LRNVIGQGAVLVGSGLAIGLVVSIPLTRMMSHLLFGVTATDTATFVGVPLLLFSVGLLASYVPARRAMRVDPSLALREE
jgi:ABC-type antimicrobial peptide transport system permease subunit